MKGVKIELSPKAETWIIKHFKHTKNAEIAERWGISETTLHRFARAHGLKKTLEFQRKCQEHAARRAEASHYVHGTYPPKGFQIPGGDRHRFQKGVTPEQRLGRKANAERIRRSTESRRKTWKLEHARALFGLPRETKLNVVRHPRQHAVNRYALKKRGYLVERGGYDCWITPDTRRSSRLEKRPFHFHEMTTT